MNWLTVEEIMHLTGWSRGYVQKKASLERWVRKGTKPQRYAAESLVQHAAK